MRMFAGADAAFNVLADAERWLEAVHLGVACLATACSQLSLLLVCHVSLPKCTLHMLG